MLIAAGRRDVYRPELPVRQGAADGAGVLSMVLGGLLIAFGICVVVIGLRSNEKIRDTRRCGPW